MTRHWPTRRGLIAGAAAAPWAGFSRAHGAAGPFQDDRVGPGFTREVVIRWGDRVEPDSPPFLPDAPTEDAAGRQFGWDAVVLGVAALPPGEDDVARALMAVAHPAASSRMMFPRGVDEPDIALLAQGASILDLERRDGLWLVADGGFHTRRITGLSPCRMTGPASERYPSAAGVIAASTGCLSAWGSVLMAEGDPAPMLMRLGRSQTVDSYGWIVEIDPSDPQSAPSKRTALGRFLRSGVASTRTADGRAVVFMSDAGPRGALLRFVSTLPTGPDNPDALDLGTLSVAVRDGRDLRFVALPDAAQRPKSTIEDARRVGAMSFDLPAGMALDRDGSLLLACRGGNPDGSVLILRAPDPAAERFTIEIGLIGGDTGIGNAPVRIPTDIAVAPDGRIWIAAENSGIAVAQPGFAGVRQVYAPPIGAVMGGIALSPDGKPAFSAVRHPGATAAANFDRPATRWPTLQPNMPPQTTVVALA